MQPNMRSYYQLARDRCLRRVEHALIWVTVTAAIAAVIVGVLVTHTDGQGELLLFLVYTWLWLPLVACVIILNLIAWLGYTIGLYLVRPQVTER